MSQIRVAHPGRPTVILPDADPYLGLTQRQRFIIDVVRSYNGNRTRAATQLGISVQSIQHAVRAGMRAGIVIPPQGRGPDRTPRQRRGDGRPLTEADLFAASSLGVNERP